MAVKQILEDSFEQAVEAGQSMVKSSAKQVKQTFSPWDMIANSFNESKDSQAHLEAKAKEQMGKNKNSTPLQFGELQKKYANQDEQKIQMMKQRLFQMVKNNDEKTLLKSQQEKAEKEKNEAYEVIEKKRKEEEQKKQQTNSEAPEGKSGRGTALMGKKKKRKPTEPQPAETKPGGGKQ